MGTLRDAMEDCPRDDYQNLTYRVVNRTRDEEREWTPELDLLFASAFELAGATSDPFCDPAVWTVLDLVHKHNERFVQALMWNSKPRSRAEARALADGVYTALATIHNTSHGTPKQKVKLDVIRGNRNVLVSTSPGVRVLVRNDADTSTLQSLSKMAAQVEGRKHATSFMLPRGGYDARSFTQGVVIVFGDNDDQTKSGAAIKVSSFRSPQGISSQDLVAVHGLEVKSVPDFFQNVSYYPNGKKNPYRDPALIARMQELGVSFDNNIFNNPWLDDQDTFGRYDE